MIVSARCPNCDQPFVSTTLAEGGLFQCTGCDWSRPVAHGLLVDGRPTSCVCCGNQDLWRQKNFPQGLGVLIVAIGAVISSIFYAYYMMIWAMGTLMLVALLDMALYIWMPDVLVCYRCNARHLDVNTTGHADFNHELFEKYRQEAIRLSQSENK